MLSKYLFKYSPDAIYGTSGSCIPEPDFVQSCQNRSNPIHHNCHDNLSSIPSDIRIDFSFESAAGAGNRIS